MPIPAAIAALTGNLERDLAGAAVTTEHLGARRWVVSAANERVAVHSEYQVIDTRRLQLKQSELWLDGEQIPRVDHYAELVRLFAEPDGGGLEDELEAEQEVPVSEAPPEVRQTCRDFGRHGMPNVTVRRSGRHWHICMDTDRIQLRLRFVAGFMHHLRPLREPQATLCGDDAITLVIDGKDLTDKVHGQMDRALALIADHQAAPAAPAIDGERPAAVNTSVAVRKQTVIRT